MKRGLIVALAALVLAACASAPAGGGSFSMEKVEAFVAGVTTKDEARATLGQPTQEVPSLNNHTTLHYEFARTPTADDPSTSVIIVLLFDQQNRFVRWRGYASE